MIKSGQLLRFDNGVNNRYKSTFSLSDVILNIGRRINAENQNKRLYDKFGNYIKK